jgi:hypothetical protein
MIMKAMVMPRAISRESRRRNGAIAVAGAAAAGAGVVIE